MTDKGLSRKEVQNVQALAREKLIAYCKPMEVIGTQIFNILEKESKVLYYPLEDQQVWGFSEKIKGISFVCINTSLPYDKQVFAAAHELYHLWYGNTGEIMISENTEELDAHKEVELMANRFAAEFLVNEDLLLQEMRVFEINKEELGIKDVVRLANLFVVPYRTMVKRLYEVGVISGKKFEAFKTYTDEQASVWYARLGLTVPIRKNKIGLSNLVDKALELYERNLITLDKLEYLLELAHLTLEEMGIDVEDNYNPPTDEELDAIMEE